ncbi:MAG: hypothetical protein WBC44_04180 [Planctomycetaceae bacterium]
MLLTTAAAAQSERSAGKTEPATPAVSTPTAAESAAEERSPYGLVKPEDGTFLPLPPGASYAEFLEWLAARRGPGYGINSVEITGRVDEDETRIELDAEVVVMVRRAEAVRVALGFTEAVLIGVEHSGTGDASYEPFSEAEGHAWSLQGRGEHRLKLKLLVPLSTQIDASQLTLTTPSDSATTTLDLQVPHGSEVTAVDGIIRSTTETDAETSIQWVGTGGRIDLTWRPKPITADPSALSASSMIFPSVLGKVVQLRTVVRVTAATGRVSAVRLLLPDGFSIIDVTGKLVRSHTEETVGGNRIAVVTLVEPTEGTIEVNLRVGAPLTTEGRIAFSGFSLPDVPADAQTGMIVIEPSTAFRIDVVDSTDGVEKREMVEPELADSKTFEFSSQPFRVELQIDPIPPSLTVAPELVFQVSSDRLDLDARFAVSIEEGDLRELRLDWTAPGWTIPPIRSGLIQEFRRGNGSGPPIDISVPGATASFVVPARANRPYDGEELEIPLPRIESPIPTATVEQAESVICLRHPDNVVVEIDTADGLEPLMNSARAASLPKPGANERLIAFVAPPGLKSIKFQVRRLSREVDVSAFVSIRPRGDHLVVDERLDYDVRFDTLSELVLTVPKSLLTQKIEFFDGSGRALPSEVLETNAGDDADVRLALDRAVIGPFSISARYEVRPAAPEGTTSNVSVPLVFPSESALDDVEVRISQLPHHTAAVAGANWVRLQSTENVGRDRWTATDVAEALSLRLRPRPAGEAKTPSVSRMLFRTVVERDGTVRTVADCRLDEPPEMLAIHFPAGLEPESFRWRGRTITPELVREPSGLMAEAELVPGSEPPVLTFAFRESGDAPIGGVAGRRIDVPRFDDSASVEQTLWRITLPESQHLFSMPDGYEAGFRWGLHRGLWTRQTDESFQHIGDWFGGDLSALGPEFETGHQYTFSRNGVATPLEITSLSRSLVVLFGAGAAIVLGYCFASGLIPRRRPALIALGSVLLIVWAFFPSQVQIFLQPALFGLALVGAATFAEWALRKRQEQLASQSPSAVEFVTILPGDGSTSVPPASIGSEDPTVLRTARPSEIAGAQDSAYDPPAVRPEPQPSARD